MMSTGLPFVNIHGAHYAVQGLSPIHFWNWQEDGPDPEKEAQYKGAEERLLEVCGVSDEDREDLILGVMDAEMRCNDLKRKDEYRRKLYSDEGMTLRLELHRLSCEPPYFDVFTPEGKKTVRFKSLSEAHKAHAAIVAKLNVVELELD